MEKILISACLLGAKVRYHGGDALLDHPVLKRWADEGRLVSVCPEVAGGLPTPRPPAELIGDGGGRAVLDRRLSVKTEDGTDLSDAFITGAGSALALARQHSIKLAILKDGSPSCGTTYIRDGSFSGRRVNDLGVTAALLERNGVRVFSDMQIELAAACLRDLERSSV